MKLDPNGNQLWEKRYTGHQTPAVASVDYPVGIALDDAGYIYVGGSIQGDNVNFIDSMGMLKYAPDGTKIYSKLYTPTGSNGAYPVAMGVDRTLGRAYTTGWDFPIGFDPDILTAKF
jgi:hypothetical protein